jgi:hypothetical protein
MESSPRSRATTEMECLSSPPLPSLPTSHLPPARCRLLRAWWPPNSSPPPPPAPRPTGGWLGWVSPPSSYLDAPSPTPFKDALLRCATLTADARIFGGAAHQVISSAVSPPVSKPKVTRVVLQPADRQARPERGPYSEGWLMTKSQRSGRDRLCQARLPCRPVPVDLRGRCSNCFS